MRYRVSRQIGYVRLLLGKSLKQIPVISFSLAIRGSYCPTSACTACCKTLMFRFPFGARAQRDIGRITPYQTYGGSSRLVALRLEQTLEPCGVCVRFRSVRVDYYTQIAIACAIDDKSSHSRAAEHERDKRVVEPRSMLCARPWTC